MWAQTVSGRAVDLVFPDASQILLDDIAVSLSRIPRYNGHTVRSHAYSVAQHLIDCDNRLPEHVDPLVRAVVLLHDAHEFATGDIISPMLRAIQFITPDGSRAIRTIQRRLDRAIHVAAGLPDAPLTPELMAAVREADLLALAVEKRDLMAQEPRDWGLDLPNADGQPVVVSHAEWVTAEVYVHRVKRALKAAGCTPLASFVS